MRIRVKTLFDCTATGVTGRWRAGQHHIDEVSWNRRRNQQRNWETLLQTVGMRTQLVNIREPRRDDNCWIFEVTTDRPDAIVDPITTLAQDCGGVPMLRNLDETPGLDPTLITQGERQNIWFEIDSDQ